MLAQSKMRLLLLTSVFTVSICCCLATVKFHGEAENVPKECVEQFDGKYGQFLKNLTSDDITKDYACFAVCVLEKWKFVDKNGDPELATYSKFDLNEYDLEQMDLCAKEYASEDLCLRVYKTQICIENYFESD